VISTQDVRMLVKTANHAIAEALREQGVLPTLAVVLTPLADPSLDGGMRALLDAATEVGVDLRVANALRPHPTGPQSPGDLQRRADTAIEAYRGLNGQITLTPSSAEPRQDGFQIGHWLALPPPTRELAEVIHLLGRDDTVHGIICPPPLPFEVVPRHLIAFFPTHKNVDGVDLRYWPRPLPGLIGELPGLPLADHLADPPGPLRALSIELMLAATLDSARKTTACAAAALRTDTDPT
jgi:hypothetical protein